MNDTDIAPPLTEKPRRHRVLKVVLALAVLAVALVLAMPAILSMGWMRERLENDASEALGAKVTIGDYRLGWFSGIAVENLAIGNPEGFPQDQQLLAVRSLRGDAGIVDLLRGRLSLEGAASGLDLKVIQKADGTTNVQALGGTPKQPPSTSGATSAPEQGGHEIRASASVDLTDMHLDLELSDATIEVTHETNGVLERMSNVHARIRKDYGTPVVSLDFGAQLDRPGGSGKPGSVELHVDAEPDPEKPVDAHLTAIGLDLSRYEPLLSSFFAPGQVTAFAGIVQANTRLTGVPAEKLSMDGSIEIDQPHFAGPLFHDMDVQAERFTVRPQLTATVPHAGKAPEVDLSKVTADLGFLDVQGLATEAASDGTPARAGMKFDVDLARLASFGGPIPAMLKDSGGRVTGELRAPLLADYGGTSMADLVKQVGVTAQLNIDRLAFVDQLVTGLKAGLSLQNGALKIDTQAGTFDGGALTLTANVDATQLDQPPFELQVGLQHAEVGASAIAALQYAVPLLAGLQKEIDAGRAVTFASKVDTTFTLTGTAFPKTGQEVLAWLNEWSGQGHLALNDGRMKPAPELGNLLSFAGVSSGTLDFNDFVTQFVLRQGFVETSQMKLDALGQQVGFSGRTSLAGVLDYTFDAKSLLAAHQDGRKVLQYLGDSPLGAKLAGTLDAPKLAMPDLQQLVQNAAEGALQQQGQDLLDKVLGGQKQDGEGKQGAPDVKGILDRILNPKKDPPK